jgi:hypothetical protein
MPDFGRWTSNGGDPSLNEINRTDRFLDALAYEQPVYATDPGEAELANLLGGWRDEVRDAPLRRALSPRDALVAFEGARESRRRGRTLAVIGSAAAAVLCLGGFVSVVAGAGPGDTLYGLRTLIFGEQQTTRDDAVMLASQQLAEVQQLIDQGQWQAAQDKLQTLTTTVATVNDVEQKQELVTQWQQLTVKVEQQDAAATIPPDVPPPVFPDVPVVVAPGTDTSTTTSPVTSIPPSTVSSSETTTTSPSETASTTTSPSETTTTSAPGTTTSTPTSLPAQQPPTTTTTSAPNSQTALQTAPATTPPPQTPKPTPPQTPKPTPQAPLPTPQAPLPTPQAPLPTPDAITPIPTPAAKTPLPTPAIVQEPEAPKSVVTTTVVIPEPGDKPGE